MPAIGINVYWLRKKYVFNNISRLVATYIQGQKEAGRIREYFYYIDHQGLLFLDDTRIKNFTSCFKSQKFLEFFFNHLQYNTTGRYDVDFPYVSLCGTERNYVRCDDLPIVFTKIISHLNTETHQLMDWFSYANASNFLVVPFQPQKIFMDVNTGRLYHPGPSKTGGIGLIKSHVAIELSQFFDFENGHDQQPTHITWKNKKYTLDTEWYKDTDRYRNRVKANQMPSVAQEKTE